MSRSLQSCSLETLRASQLQATRSSDFSFLVRWWIVSMRKTTRRPFYWLSLGPLQPATHWSLHPWSLRYAMNDSSAHARRLAVGSLSHLRFLRWHFRSLELMLLNSILRFRHNLLLKIMSCIGTDTSSPTPWWECRWSPFQDMSCRRLAFAELMSMASRMTLAWFF